MPTPQRYERFWLHETLGQRMGALVHRATMGPDPALSAFSVRLIRLPLGSAWAALRQAAVLAQAIRHPHILQVYGMGEADGFGWVAAEYTDGYDISTLKVALRRQRLCVPTALAVHIAMQALRALDYLHQNQLVHGALHEATLFAGPRHQIKLAAPMAGVGTGLHTLETRPTPFLPPNVAPDTPDADVRGVAALLQRLLWPEWPAQAQAAAPAHRISESHVPPAVCRVVRQALQPAPRWHTAAGLYRALLACNVAAPLEHAAPLLRHWVRGHDATPPWAYAPLRDLFDAPKHMPRRPSTLRRMIKPLFWGS